MTLQLSILPVQCSSQRVAFFYQIHTLCLIVFLFFVLFFLRSFTAYSNRSALHIHFCFPLLKNSFYHKVFKIVVCSVTWSMVIEKVFGFRLLYSAA